MAEYVDAVDGAAVVLVDDDVLGDVDEAPGQVTGVGGLEGRIGQPLRAPFVEMKNSMTERPSLKFERIGQLDDVAGRLGHQAAHAGQLADLVAATARAGVGHHVDVVEAVAGPSPGSSSSPSVRSSLVLDQTSTTRL